MHGNRTRIKVCGLTEPDNARAVEACGVDAIGLVFYPASKRAVDIPQARQICRALGPLVHRVALFVDPTRAQVEQVLAAVGITLLQFHGDEPNDFCASFGLPYFKAIRMRPALAPDQVMQAYPDAAGFLLDAYQPGVPGGTGDSFDWARVPRESARPLLLAGGLTPDNVAEAISQTGVYGVDLSGGVEQSPGVKNIQQVQALVAAVQRADQQRMSAN